MDENRLLIEEEGNQNDSKKLARMGKKLWVKMMILKMWVLVCQILYIPKKLMIFGWKTDGNL